MLFSELQLDPRLHKAIERIGFETCTDVQAQVIPHALLGEDVAVQSQTGTGKTLAYLIPAMHLLLNMERFAGKRMLVISPTRELSQQVASDAEDLVKDIPIEVATVIGGSGYEEQIASISGKSKDGDTWGGARSIIGTPGRVLDLIKRRDLPAKEVGIMILDEADRMFDMGFYQEVRDILTRIPAPEDRITMLFSATMNVRTENLAWQFMRNPINVNIAPEEKTVSEINQKLYHIAKEEKFAFLINYLQKEDPGSALIFTNMRHSARKIAHGLSHYEFNATYLSGDLPQEKRTKVIEKFKAGEINYLVVTDVAARGLHIDDLPLVVNYDLPEDSENYVHRIGRTARAGKSGVAISLACEDYVYGLEGIEKYIGKKLETAAVDESYLTLAESPKGKLRMPPRYPDGDTRRGGGSSGGRSSYGGGAGRGGSSRGSSSGGARRDSGYSSRPRSEGSSRRDGEYRDRDSERDSRRDNEYRDSERSSQRDSEYRDSERGPRRDSEYGGGRSSSGDGGRGRGSGEYRGRGGARRDEGESRGSRSGGRDGASGGRKRLGDMTLEERKAHYQEKYGEAFSGSGSSSGKQNRHRDAAGRGDRDGGGRERQRSGGGARSDTRTAQRSGGGDRGGRRQREDSRPDTRAGGQRGGASSNRTSSSRASSSGSTSSGRKIGAPQGKQPKGKGLLGRLFGKK